MTPRIPAIALTGLLFLLSACSVSPPLPSVAADEPLTVPTYVIGPLDQLNVFVWRSPEVSGTVVVRPDGRVTLPLVEDLAAAGKTPNQLARDIEEVLSEYIVDAVVTVSVVNFRGPFGQQIRVVGEATEPQAIPYLSQMSILDVMIQVGGLTEFADGNATKLIREVDGETREYTVRLEDLLKDGDVTANVRVLPGDIIIIPETFF